MALVPPGQDLFLGDGLLGGPIPSHGGQERFALDMSHMNAGALLDWDHRDPWDRLLAAQARLEGCALVSKDEAFDTIGLKRIW